MRRSATRLALVPAPPSPDERLSRVLVFQRQSVELLAGEVQELEEGWAVRTPSLPEVWGLNHVRVRDAITPERAVGLCQEHLEGLGYHQLYVEHEPTGRRLAQALAPEGWKVEVELHSVLERGPDRETDTSGVMEPDEEDELALMRRWISEDETVHVTEDGLRQLLESQRLTWRARRARRLGIRDPDGALAGITLVFSAGPVAQVEDVYVIPEARGRGYARALVTRAAALARPDHELTFIVADDDNWPKKLYAKLGFEPVGRTWLFHHRLGGAPSG
jgi:GNAT superfamily N-acetyltransferase